MKIPINVMEIEFYPLHFNISLTCHAIVMETFYCHLLPESLLQILHTDLRLDLNFLPIFSDLPLTRETDTHKKLSSFPKPLFLNDEIYNCTKNMCYLALRQNWCFDLWRVPNCHNPRTQLHLATLSRCFGSEIVQLPPMWEISQSASRR